MKYPRHHLALALFMLGSANPALAAPQQADLILRHVTMIDVEKGRAIPEQAVVIKGDTIVATGNDKIVSRAWKAGQTVEGNGRYLIPGLWDMHVHFGGGPELVDENKALLPLYIANGITSIRDCAGDLPHQVLGWRDDINQGRLFGPTLYTSGPKIEGIKPVWKGTIEAGSKTDVDAAITQLKGLKVDFVKITDSTLDPTLYLYAISKARREGLLVSGHIPYALTIDQAVDAGMSSIEHLDYAFKAGVRDEAVLAADFAAGKLTRGAVQDKIDAGFDPATATAAYKKMAANRVFVTPTLSISRTIAYLDKDDHSKDPELAFIGPKLRATYQWRVDRAAKATAKEKIARHRHFEQMAAIVPMLRKEGVTIMAGTDAGFLNSYDYPGFALHDELAQYVRYGMTPADALRSATRAGPDWFGKLDRYGAIGQGKAADLVLLERNPLKDISATKSIRMVILRGKTHDRAALDGLLATAQAQVATWNSIAGTKQLN